jgi:hypothetical protein
MNLIRDWTPEADALLAVLAPTTSLSRLTVKLKRSEGAIIHRAKLLKVGVKRAPRLAFKDRQNW